LKITPVGGLRHPQEYWAYLVETRAAVMEEFAHRNPEAFPGWLYNTHAASTPAPFLTATSRGLPTSPPNREQQP